MYWIVVALDMRVWQLIQEVKSGENQDVQSEKTWFG